MSKTLQSVGGQNKGSKLPGRAVSLDEVRAMIQCAGGSPSGRRNAAFLALTFGAGLRCAEALALKPGDIENLGGVTRLTIAKGKGSKSRLSILLPEFVAVVTLWTERRALLGVSNKAPLLCGITAGAARNSFGKHLTTAQMRSTVARLAAKAGLEHRIHAHGLRHGHATLLAGRGMELRVISQQLGHSSTAVTDKYLQRLDPAALAAAIGSLHTQ